MLDDTYYDDFHNVLYERMLRNKIKKDMYDNIIYDIWVNPQYFREKSIPKVQKMEEQCK